MPPRARRPSFRKAIHAAPKASPMAARYFDDPVGFAVDVLGFQPWARQADILRAVATHDRVSVRSGHKIGKSDAAAALALWFASTRPQARVIVTATVHRQVRQVCWPAVRRLYRSALQPLGGDIAMTPEAGLNWEDGRQVIGFTADDSEKFAGISGQHLLFIVDEASGVDEGIFEAIRGSAAGGAKILLIGNPTRTVGTFYDSHTRRATLWNALHVSSEESPNVVAGKMVIPGLATRAWVDEMIEDCGVTSHIVDVRIRGEFPRQAADAVISLELIELARQRYDAEAFTKSTERLEVGCDPARFGSDDTVIILRRGHAIAPPLVLKGQDTVAVAREVVRLVSQHRRADERPTVRVDAVGLGAGVADVLRTDTTFDTVDVQAAGSPRNASYQRVRDQLWFDLRDWLKDGGALPDIPRLQQELAAATYSYSTNGKYVVSSKDQMKLALKRSPDMADALALAVYQSGFVSFGCSSSYSNPMNDDCEGERGPVKTNLQGFATAFDLHCSEEIENRYSSK